MPFFVGVFYFKPSFINLRTAWQFLTKQNGIFIKNQNKPFKNQILVL